MNSTKHCLTKNIALSGMLIIIWLLGSVTLSLAQGPWTEKTPMPTARTFLYASVVEGKIYAIGGAKSTSQYPLSTVEVYDPVTDTWDTTITPMPTARWSPSSAHTETGVHLGVLCTSDYRKTVTSSNLDFYILKNYN